MPKECIDCPDRFVGKDENGRWTTCHATCPIYKAMEERNKRIQDARLRAREIRSFDCATKVKVNNIKKHNKRK